MTDPKTPPPQVWPTLRARDARSLIRFLVDAFGFEETAVYGEGDKVEHAQLSWPLGGGIMLGSERDEPDDKWPLRLPAAASHPDWPAPERLAFTRAIDAAISGAIRPAFERYRAALRDEILPRARDEAHAGILNVAGGATWVSLHHGGCVGMGYSQHAGMVIVADGTDEAAARLARVLVNDSGSGVMRHADAGYELAIKTAREQKLHLPMLAK